jgi:hypothetical protein
MNNTMVREIHGAKINPKSSLKNWVGKIRGGANYASKYGIFVLASFNDARNAASTVTNEGMISK